MIQPFAYVGTVNPNLICCVCRAPFTDAVTSRACSHTFCRECILRALSHSSSCPVDRLPLKPHDMMPAGPIVRSLVDELLVECPNHSAGCTHVCQRQLLESHVKSSCPFALIPCPQSGCEEKVLRRVADQNSDICAHLNRTCEACGSCVKICDLQDHDKECSSQIMTCSFCSIELRRSELRDHAPTCPSQMTSCNHSSSGCPWTGLRSTLPSHLRTCSYESIDGFFGIHNRSIQLLTEENAILQHKVDALEGLVQTFRREMSAVKTALGPWFRLDDSPVPVSGPSPSLEEDTSVGNRSRTAGPYTWFNNSMDGSTRSPTLSHTISEPLASMNAEPNQDILASYFPPETSPSSFNDSGVEEQRRHSTNAFNFGVPHAAYQNPRTQLVMSQRHISMGMIPPSFLDYPAHPHQTSAEALHPANTRHDSLPLLVAPVAVDTDLEGSLQGLRHSIVTLASSVDGLARRNETALTTETLRLSEEIMSLRSSVHGLRMQVHGIMVDRNAQLSTSHRVHESENGVGWLGSPPPSSRLYVNASSSGSVQPNLHSITKL